MPSRLRQSFLPSYDTGVKDYKSIRITFGDVMATLIVYLVKRGVDRPEVAAIFRKAS